MIRSWRKGERPRPVGGGYDGARNSFDSVDYRHVSFSTVGYGDIDPLGHPARVLAASLGMVNGSFVVLLTFTLFERVLGES